MEKENNNYLLGTLGAIIGAIIFSIPWVLVYVYANYILSLLAFVIAYGALTLYKKFGGVITKKTNIIIILSSLLAITIATFILIPFGLLIKEGYGLNLEYFQRLYTNSDFTKAMFNDYVLSVFFTFLGISGVIKSINKEAYQKQKGIDEDNVKIEYEPISEQIKYVESIYEKYNAFSKEQAIPDSIVIEELKVKNKLSFMSEMEKRGIVVSSFNKSYFDKEAVENEEKAKQNSRKVLKTPIIICIAIMIVVFLLAIFASNDNEEIYEEIKYQTYTYENISIDLPNTFKLDEEEDGYVYYINNDYKNGIVQEIMIEKTSFKNSSDEDRIEYQKNYTTYIKEKFAIIKEENIVVDNLKGFSIELQSIQYKEEYTYNYVLFDDDNIYMIMTFASINDSEKDLKSFEETSNSYINNTKFIHVSST